MSLEGRKSVIERPWADARRAAGDSGMVAASSSPPTHIRTPDTSPNFPIRVGNWRIFASDLLTETDRRINLCRKKEKGKYSEIGMREIIRSVADLVRAAGWMVGAGRHLKLAQRAKLADTRSFIESTHRTYQEFASGATSIYARAERGGSMKHRLPIPPRRRISKGPSKFAENRRINVGRRGGLVGNIARQ